MNAASFLATNNQPTAEEIDNAMQGNICRCGTYLRIKQAVADAAEEMYKEV
jgi:aerobic-type carbon monoxide dehydrogenase small subunit (CoxS/CutS family)